MDWLFFSLLLIFITVDPIVAFRLRTCYYVLEGRVISFSWLSHIPDAVALGM